MGDRAALWEKRFDLPLLAAALLTVPLIIVEATNVGRPWDQLAHAGDWLVWSIFVAHLGTMIRVAGWRYLWHHWVSTLVVVLSFPLAPSGLQAVRLVRVLRVIRIVRFGPIFRRFFSVEGIKYAGVLAAIALFGGAAAYSAAEGRSYATGLYWGIQTLTTIGYGDVAPHTVLGKVTACVMAVIGIGLFSTITGAITQQFLAARDEPARQARRSEEGTDAAILAEIAELTKQIKQLETLVRVRASRVS